MTPPDHEPTKGPIRFRAVYGSYSAFSVLQGNKLGNELSKRVIKIESPTLVNMLYDGVRVDPKEGDVIVHMLIWQNNDHGKPCRNVADNYIFTIDPEENVLEIKSWQEGVGGKPQKPLSAELVTNELQEAKLREPTHYERTILPLPFSIRS